ncbi:nucleoside hydrolase [Choiromyces venosus 120613-1]|uniref:Nucleoside hydrolase n=1 Tax=Choiromyces venosus 120613-1 TaxID=1336337 RepID=A0A3N4JEG1_9PEZI|nr:nucleoside hydrolase [Choiromyces venosus 120613-1]
MPPQKVIIDTDPGVDDVLALLLALSASEEELQVLLISLTFGNIDVESCLLNVVSMFHVLELERKWRRASGLPVGFGCLGAHKPLVAVGADRPLEEEEVIMADYFHGLDGLQGVHTSAPHFTPEQTWKHMFATTPVLKEDEEHPPNFKPTNVTAHKEILRILKENPVDSVTIIAVGPLTNLALAADEDPETFLRVKEVVAMGGNIGVPGNITPNGEFNVVACPFSAARIYSLTSPSPPSTAPPPSSTTKKLKPIPEALSHRLNLTIFPLDITTTHLLTQEAFTKAITPLLHFSPTSPSSTISPSPLAQWTKIFVDATFSKLKQIRFGEKIGDLDFSLHDPLCVYYVLTRHRGGWETLGDRDVRIETAGQWTRGMCVVDRRGKMIEEDLAKPVVMGDEGIWLHRGYGNRVRQVLQSPDEKGMAVEMLRRIYGGV